MNGRSASMMPRANRKWGKFVDVRKAAAALAVVVAVPTGLAACSAPPSPLTCASVATVSRPLQNSVETITVKSQSGTQVVSTAVFKSGRMPAVKLTNAHGIAQMTFPVGSAPSTFKINVSTLVRKGTRQGKCTASFVPLVRTPTSTGPTTGPSTGPPSSGSTDPGTSNTPVITSPAPLSAVITPKWLGFGVGSSISKGTGCYAPHPGTGFGCGTLQVSALISGFAGYGGLSECTTGDCHNWDGPGLSGTLRLAWESACSSTGQHYSHSQTMDLSVEWMDPNSHVNSFTRVTSDSARVELAVDMPLQNDILACLTSSTLVSEAASSVSLHLESGSGFPAANFFAAGPLNRG
jgi:hypothetical protein